MENSGLHKSSDLNSTATITAAIEDYLYQKTLSRSNKTAKTYRFGLEHFKVVLRENSVDPDQASPKALGDLLLFLHFIKHLQEHNLSASTQKLYTSAVAGFYKYLAARSLTQVNLYNLDELIKQHVRRPGQRLPQFPKDNLEKVIAYAQDLDRAPVENKRYRRINLRDRAFILTLADTGLRVHEACDLHRGDVDWNEGRAIIIGKGNKEAVVRFSDRALSALKDYLQSRQALDGATGQQLTALPLFARHDDGGEKKVKPMSTETGRNIIKGRVREVLGEKAVGTITPHSFRHYFVTTVLQATGGNIHLAQRLARHSNIGITQRYAHLSDDELDRGYHDVFNQG
ncbi:MAG: tyrosine-type recombinase/integrase [Anaerolineales bacterium]|jgi:site-specific recombinase XerD